jgi:Skp family chaperone for outer membrane proteins
LGSCLALVLIIGAGSSVAWARVGVGDLEQAVAEVERARAAAGAAGAALAEAQAEEQRLRASLGELVGELAAGEWRLAQAQQDARRRARSLYVGAGAVPAAGLPGTGERSVVRAAYAAAVGRADHEAVIALVVAIEDLEQRREQLRREATAMRDLTAHLAELEAAAGPMLAAAEAEYLRLRMEWEAQEAARLRLEQEAAVATSVPTAPSAHRARRRRPRPSPCPAGRASSSPRPWSVGDRWWCGTSRPTWWTRRWRS